MGRTEDLDGRIEALRTEVSGLLDEYLEVQEHLRVLEAATGESPDETEPPSVHHDSLGEAAWPETDHAATVIDDTAEPGSTDTDDVSGTNVDGAEPDTNGAEPDTDSADPDAGESADTERLPPASQAAVAAAVEELELDDGSDESDAGDGSDGGVERIGDDIIVG